jgi:hypothetical protein
MNGDGPREPWEDQGLRAYAYATLPVRAPRSAPYEHAPTPARVDGFQRALILEQRALRDALATAPHSVQERLVPLIADLYTILRTPIFPKGSYQALAAALVTTLVGGDNDVHLRGVLASPTAGTEMSTLVHCATIFRQHGFTPHVKLLLVQWDNLVEIRHRDVSARMDAFAQQVRAVADTARQAGLADAVIPVAVEVDADTAEILSPRDFRDWSQRVLSAVHGPGHVCAPLVRDVVWSTGFYARQVSLSRLGEKQALLDLAIRRAIGERVSADHTHTCASHPQRDDRVFALVTSELHKRFLPCYAASVPIVNLEARARVGAAATTAVA